jgi:hypothetical protein
MKFLFAFLLTGCFVLSASAQNKWREVDLKINGIGSGTSYSTVIKKIGKPLRTREDGFDECGGGYLKTLFYNGWKIQFLSDEKKRNYTVISMNLTSPKWLIASDIRIGVSIENVRAEFGQPNSSEDSEDFDKDILDYVTKENLGLVNFYFRNNKLIRVEMAETLC